jgi:PPOX class probable F420-dependent enzyme
VTPEYLQEYLGKPHICDLATVRPDGSPHVAPVWHHYDGENLIVLAEESAVKVRNIRNEPRVSASIATDARPYEYVLINGTATLSYDNIREYVLTMANNYLGEDEGAAYTEKAVRELDFVVITIKPTKIIAWESDN